MFPFDVYGRFATRLDAWPSLRHHETSPAIEWVEPLTLVQVETFLRVEYGLSVDSKQQDELTLMIAAARATAEQFQGRDLVRKQYDMVMDYWPGWDIEMRDPLISVDLFTYKDKDAVVTTMVENTDFIVDKMKAQPILTVPAGKFWPRFDPWRSSAILITFTAGYTPDSLWWKLKGAKVQRGMLQLIAHWFDNRIPWTREIGNIQEFPFTVTQLLSTGAAVRAS